MKGARGAAGESSAPTAGASVVTLSSIQKTLPVPTLLSTPMTPPMRFDQPLGHHEPDSSAFFEPGLLAEPVEWLEQLRQLVRAQAFAGVGYADADAFGSMPRCSRR